MYQETKTCVKTAVGQSKEFKVQVGVHQGSVLSPLLFNIVMDYLAKDIQRPPPWNILYADEIVLINDCLEELQEMVDQWKNALESQGLRISRTKTEMLM